MRLRAALCLVLGAGLSLPAASASSRGLLVLPPPAPEGGPVREIAITFDGLPAVRVAKGEPAASLVVFIDRLLLSFTSEQVPSVGFVNDSPDRYVGRWGISRMHHWEQAMGRPRTGAPDPPPWVGEASEKGRK